MANFQLFNTARKKLPVGDTFNACGAAAYKLSPEHELTQLVMTGCLNNTFYADAQDQLDAVLILADDIAPEYIAKLAIYSRKYGFMKDMPALLLAILASRKPELLPKVFNQVIDNGRMLRNFVQIIRSGVTGRMSLGSCPKKLVQAWLNHASEIQLLQAAVGNKPSLADIIKMVHPKPVEIWREAFFAWVIKKPYNFDDLPPQTQTLLRYKDNRSIVMPNVPFQLLTNMDLTTNQWALVAKNMGWHALRMNLNTLNRHGVFASRKDVQLIANKLADEKLIRQSKVYPYQLLTTYIATKGAVPQVIENALHHALEVSLANVPELKSNVVVCPDVSGSMYSPVTGYRQDATTVTRCIDVAALLAAAVLRKNKRAKLIPFEYITLDIDLNPYDPILENAQKLASIGGGGTNCSAPLARLVNQKAVVDTVIMISDNESWVDMHRHGATETMVQWEKLKGFNPNAKLICIDIQPYSTTQAKQQQDILNIGGFSDVIFDVIAQFANEATDLSHWINTINDIRI